MSLENYLVTGADGFIGSHLTEALVRAGHGVRAFSFYNAFGRHGWLDTLDRDIVSEIDIVAGDVRDAGAVRDAVRDCDCVLHLAALIGIPYSYRAPDSYVDTNVRGTLNVLQAARNLDVRHVVCTSTSEVYGTAQCVPIDEDHPLVGQSPYAATKIGADQLALSFHRSFDMPVSVLRPFNTYGPRQSTRAVIPTIITQLARGERRLRLGSVNTTRDFNFVLDTVSAFTTMAASDRVFGEVVNVGSGYEISIEDTAAEIADIMGVEAEISRDEERIRPPGSEVERLVCDAGKAHRLLGWETQEPGRKGLRRGLERTVEWFTDPVNLVEYRSHGYAL